jgi:uroporphyrinogen-III synthase
MNRPAAPVCVVTRTLPGAEATAARARALGWSPRLAPAMTTRATPEAARVAAALAGVQAVLLTSAAAARAVTPEAALLATPAYAVGDATAEAARAAGFARVVSAGGDAATLAMLAADRLDPARGALLHLRGGEVAGDVAGMLAACGFETRQIIVYRTEPRAGFATELHDALAEGQGAVLLHSPAGARAVAEALGAGARDLSAWRAVAMSPAALDPVRALPWAGLTHAARTDEDALLAAMLAEP